MSQNFTVVASGLTTLAYTEAGLTEITTYQYRVRAKNSFGFGDYSEISISTLMGEIGTITGLDDSSSAIVVND